MKHLLVLAMLAATAFVVLMPTANAVPNPVPCIAPFATSEAVSGVHWSFMAIRYPANWADFAIVDVGQYGLTPPLVGAEIGTAMTYLLPFPGDAASSAGGLLTDTGSATGTFAACAGV